MKAAGGTAVDVAMDVQQQMRPDDVSDKGFLCRAYGEDGCCRIKSTTYLPDDARIKNTLKRLSFCDIGASCAKLLNTALECHAVADMMGCYDAANRAKDIAWECVHTGCWKDVPMVWRDAFSLAGLLKGICEANPNDQLRKCDAVRTLDLAIMVGGILFRPELDQLVGDLHEAIYNERKEREAIKKRKRWSPHGGALSDSINCISFQKSAGQRGGESVSRFGGSDAEETGRVMNSLQGLGVDRCDSSVASMMITFTGDRGMESTLANCDLQDGHFLKNPVSSREGMDGSLLSSTPIPDSTDKDGRSGRKSQMDYTVIAAAALPQQRCKLPVRKVVQDVPLPADSLLSGTRSLVTLIPRREMPTLEEFLCDYMLPQLPVVITGAMDNWPACIRWKDLEYLQSVAGARTVPIEVGKNYLADGWHQKLMTLSDFIDEYVAKDAGEGRDMEADELVPGTGKEKDEERRAYLAQHPLFEQIPQLKMDIMEPEYCVLGGGEVHIVNAWFGPAGTVTPLHEDPYHNFLAQVVGRKYLRLYSPCHLDNMYPHDNDTLIRNTSQVDLDNVDDAAFPRFREAPFLECVLEEGQMLYIPPLWWHFVKSLSVSFSVNFFWNTTSDDCESDG